MDIREPKQIAGATRRLIPSASADARRLAGSGRAKLFPGWETAVRLVSYLVRHITRVGL